MRAVDIVGVLVKKASGRVISILTMQVILRKGETLRQQVMLMLIVASNKQGCNLYLVAHCAA